MLLNVIRGFLIFVEVITSFLLIGVILLQRSKQHGTGLTFGAGVGEQLFGAQVGNVLTRTTAVLAAVFLINTTLLAYLGSGKRETSVADGIATTPVPEQARSPVSAPPITPRPAVPVTETPVLPAVPVEAAPAPAVETAKPGAVPPAATPAPAPAANPEP
jgi:preprotein translocase subunit SecG